MTARLFRTKDSAGFTLLELVIVLGITGLIFGGLWGLISGGGAQLQAQSAAQQYRQVIEATRRLLSLGQAVGTFNPATYNSNPDGVTPGTPGDLPVSILTDAQVGLLSPNFAQSTGGLYYDAFGHEIHIAIQHMDNGNTKWRFIVYSKPNGVPAIGDKVGAQTASLIGSEGGFIYGAATEGCSNSGNFSQITCGSFNSFAFDINTNGFGTLISPTSGRIATLSFTSDTSTIGAPWLMRIPAPSGSDFNTMSAPLDFKTGGTNTLSMRGNGVFLGDGTLSVGAGLASTGSAGKVTVNGGTFSMGADGVATGGGTLNMAAGILDMQQGPINNVPTINNSSSIVMNTASGNINMNSGLGVSVNVPSIGTDPITGQPTVSIDIQGTGRASKFQAGQFIYTSDMSMKENIKPIPHALDKVLQLRGYTYDWKSNHENDVGLVAQDVEKVFPELVGSIGANRKGIDYAKIVAPLVEAIRELKAQNDALAHKVNALEKQNIAQ